MLVKSYYPFALLIFICSAKAEEVKKLDPMIISTPLHKKVAETVLPVNILTGTDLTLKQGTTIGDTLEQELGIHSSSFGSSVGRPVIRGQLGARVLVLQNGLSSLDVSAISPDHANSTEAFFAEQIEVLRGPASLLYGSGAIGGVVNVINNHIPLYVPETAQFSVEQRYSSVSEGWSSALKYEGGVDKSAWYMDGFFRENESYHVPSGGNESDVIDNTDAQSWSGTFGYSWVDDWGIIGFSINHLDNNYGIPSVDESVRIDLQQTRYDIKAEIEQPFAWAESLKFRFAYNDYQHAELEDGGIVGTQFDNRGVDGRLELVHHQFGFIDHGALGIQVQQREFSSSGEEAFIPPSRVYNVGVFAVEDMHFGDITFEAGLRMEYQQVKAEKKDSKEYIPVNAALSALWHATDEMLVSLAVTRAQRAPDIQELFSDGVHFATQSFEIGDENLDLETSYNLELGFKAEFDWFSTEINLFHHWSKDYIIQQRTGQIFDLVSDQINSSCTAGCLPVLQTIQQDARFYGFESQISFPLWDSENNRLEAGLFSDYVRGRLDRGGNVPRMPPFRYGVQLDYTGYKDFSAGLRLTRAENQNDVGANERSTDGYLLLDANLNYEWKFSENGSALFFLKGSNLLNEDIRNSTSFIRDIAPEPGRSAELGVKLTF